VQCRHAPLPERVHPSEHGLGLADGFVVNVPVEAIGGSPGFGRRLADYDVQPDAEGDTAPALRGGCLHSRDLLGDRGGRFDLTR
jgi:hypothetical protein